MPQPVEILRELARRDPQRSEATIQSQIHVLLTIAPLDLGDADLNQILLESPVGDRRRIDIELGATVIEVKRDLTIESVRRDAEQQLAGYVEHRVAQTGGRYVGVLTDGQIWRAYHLDAGLLECVADLRVNPDAADFDAWFAWIDGVLATRLAVPPSKREIERLLGANSSGHQLDMADLKALYDANRDHPEIAVKRELWGKLLKTALGTQFDTDDDELFVNHTLLVVSAEIIAHAVVGIDVGAQSARSLLSGDLFTHHANILGVVEHDFFDWPLECADTGRRWVDALARRVARFDWASVQHDAMKTLYESVISAETRKQLGEYYTPDFLAEHMLTELVPDPLNTRLLDPSCGSGTFLFQAVRRYRDAAAAAGLDAATTVNGVTSSVIGIDLHPVAVTLARVTYLLGIGADLLRDPTRPRMRVPVYIGDSLQWGQRADLFSSQALAIQTADDLQFFAEELRFPESLLADADRFDQLVSAVARAATNRERRSPHPSFAPLARNFALTGDDASMVEATFKTMCQLHDDHRNHIWSYFIRNLARPAWMARSENRVDVLIGNPPWLAYRYMSSTMKERYKQFASDRGMWSGGSVATQQDLSDVFVARAVEQYLRDGGRFGFVMPAGVLDRGQYEGFRTGNWSSTVGQVFAHFDTAWDLSAVTPYFFPRTCAVVSGTRASDVRPLGQVVESWSGLIADVSASWEQVDGWLTRTVGEVTPHGSVVRQSPYGDRFANGATIFPRVLTTVVAEAPTGDMLGVGAGRTAIRSQRGVYENRPWKDIPDMVGVVETQFLYRLLLGENVVPFGIKDPPLAVLPWSPTGQLRDPAEYPGLNEWWAKAERLWEQHRSSTMSLAENLDYRRKLTNQLPIGPHRVVITHSGMHVAAARVTTTDAIVEHQLDWCSCRDEAEALYLVGLLNAPATTIAATPLMTSGKGGGRHIGKSIWALPIPEFDSSDAAHGRIAALARHIETFVDGAELLPSRSHGHVRRALRAELAELPEMTELDNIVGSLLGLSH